MGMIVPSVELHELIARAKNRDPSAISELYDCYAGLILRYIYVRVMEHELAQDLTQEVFIKVIHGIGRFEYRDEKSFLGWLYTIATNVLNSHQRRRRLLSTPFDSQDDLIDTRSQDNARVITDRVALQQAIEQLTKDQQQVLALRFFADMSNSEIAGLLRRTEGAVKAIQHRALQSLQRILKRETDEVPTARNTSPSAAGDSYLRQTRMIDRDPGQPIVITELSSVPMEGRAGD